MISIYISIERSGSGLIFYEEDFVFLSLMSDLEGQKKFRVPKLMNIFTSYCFRLLIKMRIINNGEFERVAFWHMKVFDLRLASWTVDC